MAEEQQTPRYEIRKVYVKDSSFEIPNAPAVFVGENKQPNIDVQVGVNAQQVEGQPLWNVVLHITCTAKSEDQTLFIAEVQQAGLFEIANVPERDQTMLINVASPTNLLPFAREAVCDQITKGGFPSVMINPINFEQIFRQSQQRQQQEEQGDAQPVDGTVN
ncbi:protein-export chaperone SecB [Gammaproteobacteria bacterium]|nr:protein-export chaperone SecB [Gammaproteobacteria bacterium]